MQYDHAKMSTWPKTEPEVNLDDVVASTTGKNCKMALSLYVVENVSDNYNF